VKKIGIITEYYGSNNYGGVLQAYALCKVLNDMGFDSEQISYYKSEEELRSHLMKEKLKWSVFINPIRIRRMLIAYFLQKKVFHQQERRRKSFSEFRDKIPHSEMVYDDSNLSLTNEIYDGFVVGSDQVWNPNYWHPGYTLNFVESTKTKISYAASLGVDKLTKAQEAFFKKNIFGYKAISVREENAISLLENVLDTKTELVVDPVLLLDRDFWKSVASERTIPERYIFTYFLGDSARNREIVNSYAKNKNMKIVSLPHVGGFYRCCDEDFGDYRLSDVAPQDFLALIMNAELVFTDSFHAVAFSTIFHKQFFAFLRNESNEMNARLFQITKLIHAEERFCIDEEEYELEYLISREDVCYVDNDHDLEELRERSKDFLINSLAGQRG